MVDSKNAERVHDTVNGDSGKRPYQSPEFRIYGDIREVTQGSGTKGNFDSPSNPAHHKSII